MTIKFPSTKNLIKKLCQYVQNQGGPETKLEQKFIRYLYSYSALEDLENCSVEQLCGGALSQWRLMEYLKPNEFKISVFNPTLKRDGWTTPNTVIQVITKDMPFLVDSLRMEINRLKLNYSLMIHMGGMLVERDANYKLMNIKRYRGEIPKGTEVESPVFIEIDYQDDSKVRKEIESNLRRVLNDVTSAVRDWPQMCERMRDSIAEIETAAKPDDEEAQESVAFLNWLLSNNFTFLGVRDYVIEGSGEQKSLNLVSDSGLGVLADESSSKKHRLLAELPSQARELILSKADRIIISKTNTISTIHRPVYTDYVGVKRFDKNGNLIGERRFIGLYTSTAYSCDPLSIPFLRHKVSYVLKKSQLPMRSHSGKDLRHILANLPRDDLFQATLTELYNLAMGILHLQERRCIRLFAREDAYGRYMSCLVYVPREKFNTLLLRKIQDILLKRFHGIDMSFNTSFTASVLARIHFIVRIDPCIERTYDLIEIEHQLIEAGKSWQDEFKERALEHFGNQKGSIIFAKYKDAFSAGYRDIFPSHQATFDIEHIERLKEELDLSMTVYRPLGLRPDMLKFKLFHLGHTIPLSDALPILENLGFRVVGEAPYEIKLADDAVCWINDFTMEYMFGELPSIADITDLFESAFYAIWQGQAENDNFNNLVVYAGFTWREICVFRAYTKYLQQLGGLPFSVEYVSQTFVNNPKVAKLLLRIFQGYFDPKKLLNKKEHESLECEFIDAVDGVESLDEDRTFRHFLELIKATLRTSFYQKDQAFKNYFSLKMSPKDVPGVPLPIPAYEVFVYSPAFEGVHLRMSKVARGGIRWSDRREDFRTEVLGLMKAQQVKNAVIVPAGAKGGFVVKKSMLKLNRDEVLAEAIRCYQGFITGLLDITDNLENGKVIHPKDVVIRDDDDVYLVVAADKGTATFSDIANQISLDKGFWLGDAFASGGSTGYDHKKMGITAKGAWVSAERQFQELGVNVNTAPVRVIGIGDLAGDVFGNGVLLSSKMQLVAAFNHMHIFIDPNPDPGKSYDERKRMFQLPRSTWADYDISLISQGGGIFLRSAKSIRLTPEIKALLDCDVESMAPNELIQALLKAPVDMLWNGGIGTFIKSSSESNLDVGDRSNDHIRINGEQVRARVICEGGNLGVTQLGRIEYELSGGKVNTDFIDNSAGVDCSDHEVNIKILLNKVVESAELTEKQRNTFLAQMTDEVATLVLSDNYHQNQALSIAAFSSARYIDVYRRFMENLEEIGKLNIELEYLPSDKTIIERKTNGIGLTKPELSVLLSYAKIVVEEELKDSSLISDPYVQRYAFAAFPDMMRDHYSKEIIDHQLYPEITATQLSNQMISDMGITFVYTMFDETGANLDRIVRAYLVAHEIFHMRSLYADIESLDYKVATTVQYEMIIDITRLVRRASRWFLRNRR